MESPKFIVILLIVLGAMCIIAQGTIMMRRNSYNFGRVIECTKLNFKSTDLLQYGCVCRLRRNSNQPVDAIDRCCQVHDDCYNEALKMGCFMGDAAYHFTCDNRVPKCGNDFFTKQKCLSKACACDIATVNCFKKHENIFNQKLVGYDQNQCKAI